MRSAPCSSAARRSELVAAMTPKVKASSTTGAKKSTVATRGGGLIAVMTACWVAVSRWTDAPAVAGIPLKPFADALRNLPTEAAKYGVTFTVEETEPYFQLVTGVIVVAMAGWMFWRVRREQRSATQHHHHHHDDNNTKRTLNGDVLDLKAQDQRPQHAEDHLEVAVHDFCVVCVCVCVCV